MKKTTTAENPQKFVYVGPTIIGVATRNTVYGERPPALETAVRAHPYLAGLCVPIPRLSEASAQISGKQGGFYTLYQRALEESAEIQKGAN